MARILGVEIPNEKKVVIGLTYIYGIGHSRAKEIVEATGIDGNKKVKDLTEEEIGKIGSYIQQNFKIEGELRQEISENIKRLIDINCYRGIRHKLSLPVRGQRTRSNARTRKGPRKTVGVIRDKAARKALREKLKKERGE
ncbi:MAG TPA: 30S ribosomal protein S13 [Firmicutes bacterium]|nr:MAG: 30S ribosomal protein S13 [Candidatus Omnitrophota bacterium]HDD64945.1 30S ribosomal protein S13 [Bacillota bacterium]